MPQLGLVCLTSPGCDVRISYRTLHKASISVDALTEVYRDNVRTLRAAVHYCKTELRTLAPRRAASPARPPTAFLSPPAQDARSAAQEAPGGAFAGQPGGRSQGGPARLLGAPAAFLAGWVECRRSPR